jgi:glycolate oxidase iron-sulfur subunit
VSAFDQVRPPATETIADCVHCGFCLPTCPTYVLWDEEMDSPRGRIVLMRAGLEEDSELTAASVEHFDNCLGCMACVTACPSGVRYDQLIEDTRAQVERRFDRSPLERAWRRVLFALFPRPGRLRALSPLLAAARALRLHRLALRLVGDGEGRFSFGRSAAALVALAPPRPLRALRRRPPARLDPAGASRGRVALLQGCVQRAFFGDVNLAAARALAAEGYEVHAPRRPRCCGALALHAGEERPARTLARQTLAALEGFDAVAVTAAGCGSAMKDYGHLLRDDPEWAARAAAFGGRVRDATELLAAGDPRAPRRPLHLRVAYHDACHLAHAQGVRSAPRELLRSIPGLELVEPAEWELCCGSAGVYNLLRPGAAAELGARKARNLLATGADVVAAANPGCALQIAAHAAALGRPVPVVHPVELVWRSIEAGRSHRGAD